MNLLKYFYVGTLEYAPVASECSPPPEGAPEAVVIRRVQRPINDVLSWVCASQDWSKCVLLTATGALLNSGSPDFLERWT